MSRPHPLQWWLWAAAVSAIALLTTNLWLLLGLVVVEATVWASCPSIAEDDALMAGFVRIAVMVIVLRLALQVLFGKPVGSEVAFSLPSVDLPAWMDGITVGGTVTWAGILGATERSLQLVVVLIAFALANSRSSAHALIRVLPVSLYEIGVISAVSLRVAPAAVITSRQVKLGMRLRGYRSVGVRATGHIVSTTLSLALEQSVHLAESMEMRGLGRNDAPRSTSRIISACTLLAVTAVSVTVFGWIGGWSGAYVAGAAVVTAVCAALAARLSAQVTPRTRLTEHQRSATSTLAVMGIAAATIALGWWLTTHLEVAQPSIAPIQLPLPPAWVWLGLAVFFTQALCDTRPASPIPDLAAMIQLDAVSFSYGESAPRVLDNVSMRIEEGTLTAMVGRTGSGKSTLLRAMCGLVPHFSGGVFSGSVQLNGVDTVQHRPRELANVVGFVDQDPARSFVADTVTDELAFTIENLGIAPSAMRRRIADAAELVGIAELLERPLASLSGGQAQRVAIASVLAAQPRIVILDEPTSALDPAGAEEVLSAIHHLVHDIGLTVVLSEHRLERVAHLCDHVIVVESPSSIRLHDAAHGWQHSELAPPVVELARALDWQPVTRSVREARAQLEPYRELLAGAVSPSDHLHTSGRCVRRIEHFSFSYGQHLALADVSLDVTAGEILAVMGRNGSGKSTLLHHLALGDTMHSSAPRRWRRRRLEQPDLSVALVPQNPATLFLYNTLGEELAMSDRDGGAASSPGDTAGLVERLLGAPIGGLDRHPTELSHGQQLAMALAIMLTRRPQLIVLDEPTRGLDLVAKHRLTEVLRACAARDVAVVIATHDVEFVAGLADRVAVLERGRKIADAATREVMCHSMSLAPQAARVAHPLEYVTVDELVAAVHSVQRT